MKKILMMSILAFGVMTSVQAANRPIDANKVSSRQTVSYTCQQGKKVNVRYAFNAAGIPVNASVKIAGAIRTLPYDLASSDNVDTNFQDKKGFRLNMEGMERKNVNSANIAVINTPSGDVVYKDCAPQ